MGLSAQCSKRKLVSPTRSDRQRRIYSNLATHESSCRPKPEAAWLHRTIRSARRFQRGAQQGFATGSVRVRWYYRRRCTGSRHRPTHCTLSRSERGSRDRSFLQNCLGSPVPSTRARRSLSHRYSLDYTRLRAGKHWPGPQRQKTSSATLLSSPASAALRLANRCTNSTDNWRRDAGLSAVRMSLEC